ncbi:MAG: hypothetical protein H6830_12020 [Planctomycetes bacterium]|nr:hypothetical protein [Planctomycetota bacterium]MCB9910806.1 hypothetical protein [Planctomycetota bacterium]MCB9912262.1 hypothetical protein [Planctomycetota bacterium]HPF12781.1 hypothetical protein [Planctomycetota bacterium]
MDKATQILQILYYVSVLLGLPFGLYQYWRRLCQEQLSRELQTYDSLDNKYLQYQRICLEHPELDIADFPHEVAPTYTDEQKRQETTAFIMLISIFERAYVLYNAQAKFVPKRLIQRRRTERMGWEVYMASYCQRNNFATIAEECSKTFHSDFREYFLNLLAQAKPTARLQMVKQERR